MTPVGDYRINPFLAEFSMPAVERCFRDHVGSETARYTSLSLLIGAIFFMTFGYTDFLAMGYTLDFALVFGARVAAGMFAIAVTVLISRRPAVATRGLWISAVELSILAAFVPFCLLNNGTAMLHGMGMLVILLAFYLFIPNRFVYALMVSLLGTAGFMALLVMNMQPPPDILAVLILLLLLVNTFGALATHRFSHMRREEYRLLQAEREANRLLGHEIGERRRLQEELSRLARTDPLTGLLNRRYYLELSEMARRQAKRFHHPLSVVFMDVDNFKQINDTRGHATGDEALRTVARVCSDTLRDVDVIGRFGGEEFAITMPRTTLGNAVATAERLRERLESTAVPTPQGPLHLTVSIGVAQCPTAAPDIAEALHAADKALYQGKASGRNRVVAAPVAPEPNADIKPDEAAR